jgi:1,4-dihydroxy-2-naphthoyl-CoA synthase
MNRHKGEPLINRTNWQETREYLTYCTEVKQNSPGSIRIIESSLKTCCAGHKIAGCRMFRVYVPPIRSTW